MNTTVWKFPLAVQERQCLALPPGAKPLHVALQKGTPWLWTAVDPDERQYERVEVIGLETGQDWPAPLGAYLGTVHLHEGRYVLHYFLKG